MPAPMATSCTRTSPVRQPSGTRMLNSTTTNTVNAACPTTKFTAPGVYAARNTTIGQRDPQTRCRRRRSSPSTRVATPKPHERAGERLQRGRTGAERVRAQHRQRRRAPPRTRARPRWSSPRGPRARGRAPARAALRNRTDRRLQCARGASRGAGRARRAPSARERTRSCAAIVGARCAICIVASERRRSGNVGVKPSTTRSRRRRRATTCARPAFERARVLVARLRRAGSTSTGRSAVSPASTSRSSPPATSEMHADERGVLRRGIGGGRRLGRRSPRSRSADQPAHRDHQRDERALPGDAPGGSVDDPGAVRRASRRPPRSRLEVARRRRTRRRTAAASRSTLRRRGADPVALVHRPERTRRRPRRPATPTSQPELARPRGSPRPPASSPRARRRAWRRCRRRRSSHRGRPRTTIANTTTSVTTIAGDDGVGERGPERDRAAPPTTASSEVGPEATREWTTEVGEDQGGERTEGGEQRGRRVAGHDEHGEHERDHEAGACRLAQVDPVGIREATVTAHDDCTGGSYRPRRVVETVVELASELGTGLASRLTPWPSRRCAGSRRSTA